MLETADIRLKFCTLASNFHESLLTRNVNVRKLNDKVHTFHPYYYERVYKYRATDVTNVKLSELFLLRYMMCSARVACHSINSPLLESVRINVMF